MVLARLLTLLSIVAANEWFDNYVSTPDDVFDWYEVPDSRFTTPMGGQAYLVNVTSIRWLDTSKASGPNGDIWSHIAVVVVPKHLKFLNISLSYISGNCNSNPNAHPKKLDDDVLLAD